MCETSRAASHTQEGQERPPGKKRHLKVRPKNKQESVRSRVSVNACQTERQVCAMRRKGSFRTAEASTAQGEHEAWSWRERERERGQHGLESVLHPDGDGIINEGCKQGVQDEVDVVVEIALLAVPVTMQSGCWKRGRVGTGWGCCDHPGQGGPARDYLTVGGCPDCFLAGSQGCFLKLFLKCVLIGPSTRDHLRLQLLAVSSEFFPLKSIRPPGEWTVQWKERRHFLRVLFSTVQTLPQSSVLLS